ncbi:GNAT family N-acetyltransferase [Actinomyces sp. oral taxon 171]|uniref:GNAT family N-acetyltransferase n=1 Tax=Actinomyces sp. oral taxon 171 TaxID=706438 RepID=UPI0001F620B5|nr:GNAT family N-acetyltransferase [Actinomyces sp. oral taxon 171]EFW26413.1 ribosomal-protein-alanine acetyltransferase [Actinomyces sp. oral taxon 171 str. F0337]QCT32632.1 GNAT family N-acetyltransferase [Actinomyces sp. oral taxon 171 str. F0337]
MPEVTGLGWAPRVREMAVEDLEAVARLEGELFGAEAWSRDLLAAELKASHGPRADRRYVVVESDAADRDGGGGLDGPRLLGYAGLYHAGGLSGADLLTIATIPSARGRGIASVMLIELVSTAREVGCPDVLLEVRQSNGAAQRLYARHGFVPIGRRRRYYQAPPEDAVVMRLTLRPRPGPVGAEAGESNPI